MGLAAGQARLLSITSRKSDCEFQSMRLSHQKIALSRELADLSNEYQNSLDQTKLIYDYYGTGDTTTPLTYGILMNPSTLNDYMPITLTDTSGRVTLNSKYAAAARAAGIPQEGLGTLPSESMRNAFINGLADSGLITSKMAKTITGLPYNQGAGFGGGALTALMTETGTIYDLAEYINENGEAYTISSFQEGETGKEVFYGQDGSDEPVIPKVGVGENGTSSLTDGDTDNYSFTLGDLLTDENQYHLDYFSIHGECSPVIGVIMMQNYLTEPDGFIDWLYDEFSAVLDLGDGITGSALEYAYRETVNLISNPNEPYRSEHSDYEDIQNSFWSGLSTDLIDKDDWEKSDIDEATEYGDQHIKEYGEGYKNKHNNGVDSDKYSGTVYTAKDLLNPVGTHIDGSATESKSEEWTNANCGHYSDIFEQSENYVGFLFNAENKQGASDNKSTASINLNNLAKAFLTYFADFMNGVSKTDANGTQIYEVAAGSCKNGVDVNVNKLVTDNNLFQYTFKTDTVASDDLGQAQFYDALFNQICINGWTEDNNIEDKEYLQQLLQSGKLYISKIKDDGYYYQANYATDAYIKEIADETYVAQAESRYNTQKAKLNAKEESLDMKMKNLDTEISSLTTEYDTVKNTISKNIEKSFKRYNA